MALARRVAVAAALAVGLASPSLPLSGQGRLVVAPGDAAGVSTDLLERYARGEASAIEVPSAQVAEHLQHVRRAAARWVGPKDARDAARRRLAVATYLAEFIDENFDLVWRRGLGSSTVDWACQLVREAPAIPAERSWHLAVVAILERADGVARPLAVGGIRTFVPESGLRAHVADAELRFPRDAEWALARAISRELATWPLPHDERPTRFPAGLEGNVSSEFRLAAAHPEVAAEAYLRLGFFELRQGQFDTALAEFDHAGTPEDGALRYWVHLFRGRALERLNRGAEAVEAFRRAFAEVPYAQSATIALGTSLVGQRRSVEANELIGTMLHTDPPLDPWRFYGFPAYRHWAAIVGELRKAIRP